jgi:hypothetical protein
MPPESWLIVTVAAAFLLLGVAGSPMAWVALLQRRSRSEREVENRLLDLACQLHTLQARVERCEARSRTHGADSPTKPPGSARERPAPGPTLFEFEGPGQRRAAILRAGRPEDPPLIAVPNLASASPDRQATHDTLGQRYAAIWSLADTGAPPEVIARAIGQPIGQIELILRLRRKIDGVGTTIPHASHE